MGLIPDCVTDRQLTHMSDSDFERLVVAPGERLCADLLVMCRQWRDDNQAFLDECYDGITMEQARERFVTNEQRETVQDEYRNWYHIRRELRLARLTGKAVK